MRSLRAFSLALAVAGALTGVAATTATADVQPMIVGGEKVTSAPWAAAVHYGGAFHCSGSIIGAKWALTAEHCLGKDMYLRVGSVYRSSGGTQVKVIRQIAHPSSDIALLELETSVTTTYAKLADTDPKVGDTNAIFGWGREKYDWSSPAPEQLKTANVKVTRVGETIASTGVNGGAWSGDSGGAQFAGDVQVGVASTASALFDKKQNYVSVAKVRSWIKSTSGI